MRTLLTVSVAAFAATAYAQTQDRRDPVEVANVVLLEAMRAYPDGGELAQLVYEDEVVIGAYWATEPGNGSVTVDLGRNPRTGRTAVLALFKAQDLLLLGSCQEAFPILAFADARRRQLMLGRVQLDVAAHTRPPLQPELVKDWFTLELEAHLAAAKAAVRYDVTHVRPSYQLYRRYGARQLARQLAEEIGKSPRYRPFRLLLQAAAESFADRVERPTPLTTATTSAPSDGADVSFLLI